MLIIPFKNIHPRIDESAFNAPGANIIGDVEIGARSSVWFGSTIRGDVNYIRIGVDTNIQDGCIVHVDSGRFATLIGDRVTVGHGAVLHACEIHNYAFIGMQSCVLDGAVVEEKAMVAAGALVTPGKTVPTGELWAGRPARLMRKLTEEEMMHFEKSARDYAELAKIYKNEING